MHDPALVPAMPDGAVSSGKRDNSLSQFLLRYGIVLALLSLIHI